MDDGDVDDDDEGVSCWQRCVFFFSALTLNDDDGNDEADDGAWINAHILLS